MFRALLTSLSLLLHACAASPGPDSRGLVEVHAASHGIELALAVPRRAYPRNALVRVTVTIRNRSKRAQQVAPSCGAGAASSWVESVARNGLEVFPQDLPQPGLFSLARCPTDLRLAPGMSIAVTNYVILRTRYLHARLSIPVDRYREVVTRPLALPLRSGPSPRAVVRTLGRLSADILPPAGARGPLIYGQWVYCRPQGVYIGAPQFNWQVAAGNRIAPRIPTTEPCGRVTEWHVVAGWLNHPVVFIAYRWTGKQSDASPTSNS